MNLRNKLKTSLALVLSFMILLSSMPVYGAKARFKDVPKTRWSYEYVEKMAKLGVLEGYGDNTFAPTKNLTFLESMAAMSRLRKPTEKDKKAAMDQYAGLMKELKITPHWEREALSLAMYQGIVSPNEVRSAHKQNIFHKPIQKVAASVFLAKAMGLEDKANSLSVVFIEYKDVLKIDPALRKYLKVLLDAGVLDKKGDGAGNFNPTEPLRREILATMLSRAYDYMEKNPGEKPSVPEKPVEKPSNNVENLKAHIIEVIREGGKDYLLVEERSGKETKYLITNTTNIKVENKKASIDNLRPDQEVNLEVDGKGNLLTISAKDIEEELRGAIRSLDLVNSKLELEFKDSNKVSRKTFNVRENARIEKDDRRTNLVNLKSGDYVELVLHSGEIVDIYAESKNKEIEGNIVEIDKDNKGIVVYVEDEDNKETKVLIDSKTDILRDGKKAKMEDLKLTDDVFIIASYDVDSDMFLADEVDAELVIEKINGVVVEVTNRFGRNPLIKVKNLKTNKEESYELNSDAYIEVDGRREKSLPTNPGYEAELHIEGASNIVEIIIDTTSVDTSVNGKITYIDLREDYIELEIRSGFEIKDEILRVYVDRDTKILNRNLNSIDLDDLYEDDNVVVIGTYKGAKFVAETIMLRN